MADQDIAQTSHDAPLSLGGSMIKYWGRQLRHSLEQTDHAALEPHPTDEEITRFTQNQLGVDRDFMRAHILLCIRCSDRVKSAFRKTAQEEFSGDGRSGLFESDAHINSVPQLQFRFQDLAVKLEAPIPRLTHRIGDNDSMTMPSARVQSPGRIGLGKGKQDISIQCLLAERIGDFEVSVLFESKADGESQLRVQTQTKEERYDQTEMPLTVSYNGESRALVVPLSYDERGLIEGSAIIEQNGPEKAGS